MDSPRIIADRYEVLGIIGHGGASSVLKAKDLNTGEVLALKHLSRLQNSPEETDRFHREFRLLSRLDHPYIVSVKDTGADGEVPYFTMDYLEGSTLEQVLKDPDNPLCVALRSGSDPLVRLLSQLCSALTCIHNRGMIHRDLKPGNIFILSEDSDPRIKILDLGTAKFQGDTQGPTTRSGAILGTVQYMSPEQVRGVYVDGRSDLYALGIILYEILTGKRPFHGANAVEVAFKQINDLPVPPRVFNLDVPHSFQLITLKLLEKEPARRYRSAADLLADLEAPEPRASTIAPEARPSDLLLYPKFLGRRDQMAEARAAFADVQRGRGRNLAISGEPGIGKTRFLEELSADARLQGIRILSGSCLADRTAPFQPLVESIRSAAKEFGSLFTWVPETDRPELARLFHELADAATEEQIPPVQFRRQDQTALFEALYRLFETLGRVTPLMLCLDDIQWADRATFDFLAYLAGRLDNLPLFLCVAHRPFDTVSPLNAWVRKAESSPLSTLDSAGTEDLVASTLGTVDVPEALATEIFGLSGGNPFFVIEAVKALVERGTIAWKKDRWTYRGASQALPPQVEQMILERVERLLEAPRKVLAYASVVNRAFPLDLLAATWEGGEDDLFDHLGQLVRQNFLNKDLQDHYSLFHSLTAESVYNSLDPEQRKDLHRDVGHALEQDNQGRIDEAAGEIAYHFLQAGTSLKAVPYLTKAGDRALRAYAYTDAREAYEQAVRIVETSGTENGQHPDTYPALICSYVEALKWTGDWDGVQKYAEKGLGLQRLSLTRRGYLQRNLGLFLEIRGQYDPAEKSYFQAIEIYRQLKDQQGEIYTLAHLINLYWLAGDYKKASRHIESVQTLCQALGDDFHLAIGAYILANDHLTNSRLSEAEAAFQDALKRFEHLEDRQRTYGCLSSLREIYTYRGRFRDAEKLNRQIVDTYRERGDISSVAYHTLDLGYIYFESGDLTKAESHYLSALETLSELKQYRKLQLAHTRLSELYLKQGDAEKALDYATRAKEMDGSEPVRRSQVCRVLAMSFAALGRHDEASEWFDSSLEALKDRPGFQLARALLETGKFHLATGAYDVAEAHLGRAVDMFEQMGADHFLHKAQQAWRDLVELRDKHRETAHAEEGRPVPSLSESGKPTSTLDTDRLLNEAVDRLLQTTDAERGLILTVQDGRPRVQTACFRRLDEPSVADISGSIVRAAIDTADLIVTTDAPNDPRFQSSQSILDYKIRSILCMPLKARDGSIIGAIYADHRGVAYFSPKQIQFFRAFGDFVAVALENALGYQGLKEDLEKLAGVRTRFGDLIGASSPMQTVYDLVERLSETDVTVLLQGETGTGKGLVARTIHARSSRADKPFLALNCGALPRELLESELFGHTRGAFTGASSDRKGLFEAADGGTVFLDEVGDAPPEVQVRLLHVLEEGAVKRVGENHTRRVDVRVIAATNQDLEGEVDADRFRNDLYYRLRVISVSIPPLRDRVEDIPLLANHFLDLYNRLTGKSVPGLAPDLIRAFSRYDWPGNIRELENEIRRGVALVQPGSPIFAEHLSERISPLVTTLKPVVAISGSLKAAVEQFEQDAIRAALEKNGWNVTHTAREVGLTRAGLQGKMRKYGIRR